MDAKFLILYGMSDTICEAQRQCAPIMDDCGGTIDTTTSVCHGPSVWPSRSWRTKHDIG